MVESQRLSLNIFANVSQTSLDDNEVWLKQVKDKLTAADDLTGNDEDLVTRLQTAKVSS